jgi:hypothetical protein
MPGLRAKTSRRTCDSLFEPSDAVVAAAATCVAQALAYRRTIRDIAECVAHGDDPPQNGAGELGKFGRKLFQSLGRLDLVAMALSATRLAD